MKDHSIVGYLERLSIEELHLALQHYQKETKSEETEKMIKKVCEIIEKRNKKHPE